jgi:hypothetical protein
MLSIINSIFSGAAWIVGVMLTKYVLIVSVVAFFEDDLVLDYKRYKIVKTGSHD